MNFLPFAEEMYLMLGHLGHQTAHVGPFDTNALNGHRHAIRAKKGDLCQPRPGDVNMGRLMIEGVDHKPETMGAVCDNHLLI